LTRMCKTKGQREGTELFQLSIVGGGRVTRVYKMGLKHLPLPLAQKGGSPPLLHGQCNQPELAPKAAALAAWMRTCPAHAQAL